MIRYGAPPNARNREGRTALRIAAVNIYKELVSYLCERNADPWLKDQFRQDAARGHAIRRRGPDAQRTEHSKGASEEDIQVTIELS